MGKSNPLLYRKAADLIEQIAQHPREGTGRQKTLKGGLTKFYSRRISGSDRIVYTIDEEIITVVVVQIGGHYDDK